MTISSSLNAGIMGLNVNSTRLGNIADNIANSDTYGYKRSVSEFQTLVIQSNTSSFAAGGVQVQTYRLVDEEGSLITTGNSTDISVGGRGFIPVTNVDGTNPDNPSPDLLLTTTGSFSADKDGYLRTAGGLFLMGWPADSNGEVGAITRQGGASLEPVRVDVTQFRSTPTRNINLGINLPADATESTETGAPYDSTIEYYDNLGRVQVMTGEFTPVIPGSGASNQWQVELFDNSTGSPVSVATFDVEFQDTQNNGGAILSVSNNATYDAATGEITVTLPSGDIQMFVGRPDDRSGLTQFATDFAPYNLSKDGSAIGNLVNLEIDPQGRLQAIYDTGVRQTIYQIPVADVPNPNGLTATNNQSYTVSQQSGDVYFWDAGSGPVGETVGYSLMESTTDIAAELTAMIETQRAYSSNAKVIQTVDEILQETTNIIR